MSGAGRGVIARSKARAMARANRSDIAVSSQSPNSPRLTIQLGLIAFGRWAQFTV